MTEQHWTPQPGDEVIVREDKTISVKTWRSTVQDDEELINKLMTATTDAVWDEGLMHLDSPETVAKRALVAAMGVLTEVAPGTPQYAVEFDFNGIAEQIKQRP